MVACYRYPKRMRGVYVCIYDHLALNCFLYHVKMEWSYLEFKFTYGREGMINLICKVPRVNTNVNALLMFCLLSLPEHRRFSHRRWGKELLWPMRR